MMSITLYTPSTPRGASCVGAFGNRMASSPFDMARCSDHCFGGVFCSRSINDRSAASSSNVVSFRLPWYSENRSLSERRSSTCWHEAQWSTCIESSRWRGVPWSSIKSDASSSSDGHGCMVDNNLNLLSTVERDPLEFGYFLMQQFDHA